MAKKFNFSYPYASYMDVSMMRENKTRKELIAEYSRMQAEANRRLHQLSKYKWMRDSDAYTKNVDSFMQTRFELYHTSKADIAKKMREAAIFLTAQSSRVQGQRQHRDRLLDTFKYEWGLDFLNRTNVVEFSRFLKAARTYYGAGSYNLDSVAEMFQKIKTENLDSEKVKKNFAAFVEADKSGNYDEFRREGADRFSADDFNK